MSYNELILLATAVLACLIALLALSFSLRTFMKYKRLYRQYDRFMRGKDAESLEDFISILKMEVDALKEEEQNNKDMLKVVNRNHRASFQKFGMIRYNAFAGMGGNMSFALAFLDFTNSGFVLNCIHSRDGCNLYIKEVDAGTTEIELGSEERYALERALGYREKES